MNYTDLTSITIDHKKLIHNFNAYKNILKNKKILPVIKSNAYGHGMIDIAKTLQKNNVYKLAVVTFQEAQILRKNGVIVPIIIIGFIENIHLEEASRLNIEIAIFNKEQIEYLKNNHNKLNTELKIHIKIETGMNRLGLNTTEAPQLIKKLQNIPNIKIEGIYTHFSDAETPENIHTKIQIEKFTKLLDLIPEIVKNIPDIHAGASAATLSHPESHFTMIRLGISLYGIWPSKETQLLAQHSDKIPSLQLKPILQWHTKIINIKKIKTNESIGYGCTHKTHQDTIIAVIPIGYADGYPRSLSNKAHVLVNNKRAPILGRICMNMTIIDITHIKNTKINNKVTLIGIQGKEEITSRELANHANTISYEILTRINWSINKSSL